MTAVRLLGPDAKPIPEAALRAARARARMSMYQAASTRHQDLATWTPFGASGQSAISHERDLIAARVHDIVRNDGWASAGLGRYVDNVIGAGWRLSAKPNARSLGIEQEAAEEFADAIEAEWQDFASDPGMWCDVERRRTMAGLLSLGFRHRILDGEALAVVFWKPRGGRYATSLKLIDPDRLSMPMGRLETDTLRSGVEMDEDGAPVAYHIRVFHPGDMLVGAFNAFQWERIPRETPWGRPVVIHAYEAGRAGEVRGVPVMTPIVRKLKQVTRYDEAELQAAIINAIFAAFVTSPFDHEEAADSIAGGGLNSYQEARLAYYEDTPLRLPGAQVSFLYPGETINLPKPSHPNSTYEAFERASLRNIASATGLSYEQLTMDWSQVNYSSARAALLEIWRGFTSRKSAFAAAFMQPFYVAWLEEALETGRVKPPVGAPPFQECRAAYAHAEWIGPGRGWVDPQREAEAAATRLDVGITTLERECAEQGLDWKEVAAQRARENRFLESLGLSATQPLRAARTPVSEGQQP